MNHVTITTGQHPGQTGACIAQYNHHTLGHSYQQYYQNSHHSSHYSNHNHNSHIMPYNQQPMTAPGYYGSQAWRPPIIY